MIRNLFTILVCGWALSPMALASSQNKLSRDYVLPISQQGQADSPIVASGHVTVHEEVSADSILEKPTYDVIFKNVSSKPILAYEILIVLTSQQGLMVRERDLSDFLFRKELELSPGGEDAWESETSAMVSTPSGQQSKANAGVTASVEFVEFVDGTTYGKSSWGVGLHKGRREAIEAIHTALQEYQAKGDNGLRAALDGAISRPGLTKHAADVLRALRGIVDSDGATTASMRMSHFLDAAVRKPNSTQD